MLHDPRARVLIGAETLDLSNKRKPAIVAGASATYDSVMNESFFASVSVELTTDKASEAEWTVVDEELSFLDSYTNDDGVLPCAASIYLGYGEGFGEPVFDGLLAAVEHTDGLTTLCFYDRSLRMKLEDKTEHHKGSDLDVMRKLVERNGLNFVLADDSIKGLPLKAKKQDGATDYEFFMSLTRDAGLVSYVRGHTLFVARPARVVDPVLTLKRRDVFALKGEHLRYEMPENVDGSPASVEVRTRGRAGKRLSGHSVKKGRGRKRIVHHSTGTRSAGPEARRRAQAIQDLESEPSFTCRVKSLFTPETRSVEVRDTLMLEDRGELFSGLYLVDSLHLGFEPGALTVDFDLVRQVFSCAELMKITNAATIYPGAFRRCSERLQRATSK